jgi:hypothetical protein
MQATEDRSNRLSITRAGSQLVTDYWDDLFTAREQGKQIVWYNGGALNPIFQAAGLAWCHGEAFAARLAAQRLEGPAQLAGAEYGYNAELCSYARTHLGCSVLTLQSTEGERSGVVGMNDQKELAARLPSPDFFVNNYAGCSTGQQWDGISFRVSGKQLPIFNISHPFLWGNKADAGYLQGEEWEAASRYVAGQLRELISFLEAQTGRPFDYDVLSEAMTYIKRAAELRREGLDLCKARPAPATFWDWIACVAPINFLPGDQALVDYFAGVRDEIQGRLEAVAHAGPLGDERGLVDQAHVMEHLAFGPESRQESPRRLLGGRHELGVRPLTAGPGVWYAVDQGQPAGHSGRRVVKRLAHGDVADLASFRRPV